MKQLLIISGKGGTGKTVITASLAHLLKNKVIVDCDVDAADLHILLHPRIKEKHSFQGTPKAKIDLEQCTGCGECIKVCKYDAISPQFIVDPVSCEGCRVCKYICAVQAITMKENISGEWYISETEYGLFLHAKLGIAEENSGKLVSVVRQRAKETAEKKNADYVLIDGPPGIGCPVIASITGADLVLVVTEPTLSGLHDLDRVADLTGHFQIPALVCVNKWDLNPQVSSRIEARARQRGLVLAQKVRYDTVVTEAQVRGRTVVEYERDGCAEDIRRLWDVVREELRKPKDLGGAPAGGQ